MSTTGNEQVGIDETILEREPYEVIENPAVGQTFRLLDRRGDDMEGYIRGEIRYAADSVGFDEHVHPVQEETFTVLSGRMNITLDGEAQTLEPGETVIFPAGVRHTHEAEPGIETRVLWQVTPPMAGEGLARMLASLAAAGRTDDRGTPSLLAMATFLDAHPDCVYLSSPPISVQKALFKLLAPIGRWRGYVAEYPPAPATESA